MLRRITLLIILTVLASIAYLETQTVVQSQSGLRRLTATPEHATSLNPTLSDDGTLVAFESTADLSRTGGSNGFHAITQYLATEGFEEIAKTRLVCPSLTDDATVVVFASTEDLIGENADRNSEIFLFEHGSARQVTYTTPDSIETRLGDGNFQPQISGDARFITFSTTRTFANITPGITLLDRTTSKFINVAAATEGVNLSQPKLSGDGSRVVFISSDQSEHHSHLISFDSETHETRLLATLPVDAQFANARAVNFDGSRVVFSADSAPNQSQIFLFDEGDGEIRQLTNLPSRTTDVPLNPTISGDGKRIAFATRRRVVNPSDGSVELYVIDLPTGVTQQITNAPAQATAEVVSSLNHDGSLVVFNFSRLLSGPVTEEDFSNNCEIYVSTVASRPAFGIAEAFNGAAEDSASSQAKTFAPDSLLRVIGTAFSTRSVNAQMTTNHFPLSLAGLTASVNGRAAELIYVSPTEATVLLPAGVSDGPTELVLINRDGFQFRAPVVIARAAPGLFSFDDKNNGAVLDATRLITSPLDPTDGNLRLSVFATGLRHARSISAQLNGDPVAVERIVPSNVPGLDEMHLAISSSFRGVGRVLLSVLADDMMSNEVAFDLSGTPIRDVLINEFLADPPDGLAGDANRDGTRSASADEFVELVNTTTRDLNLSGYKLFTRSSSGGETLRHTFPASVILAAGTSIVIFGGGNPDASMNAFGGSTVLKASTGSLSLSNSGGAIILKDAAGETVSSVSYGSQIGLAADINESLTRFPDLSGGLMKSSVDAGLFSPGTRTNGSPFLPNPAVTRIEVFAPRAELRVGETLQLSATAFDVNNSALSNVLFSWQISPSTNATINSSGLLLGLRSGSASVVASARGVSSHPLSIIVSQPTPTATPTPTPIPTPTPVPTPSILPSPTPTPTPASSPTPLPTGLSPVVISEFRTRGPNGASDEFIEIYNRSNESIDISGWKIKGSSSSGVVATRVVISANTVLPSHRHFLATHVSGYSGDVNGDQTYSSGLVNDGGIALTLSDDTVVDQVGLSSGSAFREGLSLAPLSNDSNQSYERKPGGSSGNSIDTDDNSNDFMLATPANPQNLNSHSTPEPTPGPTPGPTPSPSASPSPTPTPTPTPLPTPLPSPSPTPSPAPTPSPIATPGIRINQIFGGGGNVGAPFRNDFIEIINGGSTGIDLTNWSIQYASATASTWAVTQLTAVHLGPGQHYLVQQSSGGSNGAPVPAPDVAGTIALAATAGKLALVRTSTPLSGSCPAISDIVDFVGYGSTANCFRGSAPAPAPSNTIAIHRAENGCADSQNNAADFATGPPNPRNTSSVITSCAQADAVDLFQTLVLKENSPFSDILFEAQSNRDDDLHQWLNHWTVHWWSLLLQNTVARGGQAAPYNHWCDVTLCLKPP